MVQASMHLQQVSINRSSMNSILGQIIELQRQAGNNIMGGQ